MKSADDITSIFRKHGLRVTPQRHAIFRRLHRNETHPTVESLHEQVRVDMPTISLKTVYQTVHDLEALGEVRVLDLGTGSVRVDPNVDDAHHHLVCTACGRVRDVPLALAPHLPTRYRYEFTVDDVQVIFRGRCDHCSDRD